MLLKWLKWLCLLWLSFKPTNSLTVFLVLLFLQIEKAKENKAPDAFRSEGTKFKTSFAQSTKNPPKKALGVSNRVNVTGNTQTGQQRAKQPSSVHDAAKLKLNRNPVLSQKDPVVRSKSNQSTVTNPNNQSNQGMQPFSQTFQKTAPFRKFSSGSKSALPGPAKTVSTRISLGPLVKTKTGLIPAVTQPRNTQSHSLHIPVPVAHTTTSIKVRPSTASTVVSQKSAVTQRKVFPSSAFNKRVNEKTGSQNCFSKQLPGKHSQQSCQSSNPGLKSLPTSKRTVAPVKLDRSGGTTTKINKPAVEQADRLIKQSKSNSNGAKNGNPSKVHSQTSLEATRRPAPKVVSRQVTQPTVADMKVQTKSCKETQGKKGQTTANTPLPFTVMKRSGAPVMSQTAPQPTRTVSFTGRATNPKTPKVSVPQTEVKKMTADQVERM